MTYRLETERLLLRLVTAGDLPFIARLMAEERNCLARGHAVGCNMMLLTREQFQMKQAA